MQLKTEQARPNVERDRIRQQNQKVSEDMQVVLLRVGINTGCDGINGALFKDGSFEYIPIPDGGGVDDRTYGNTEGKHGRFLVDYFPKPRRERAFAKAIHFDPEFETYTYGDPTRLKSSLGRLAAGDLLVFYAGLKGWHFECPPALHIIGFFEVECAGIAADMGDLELDRLFARNFHVRHREVLARQRERLVLVKGGAGSRLLRRAEPLSRNGKNCGGRRLYRLSEDMEKVFGDFGGHTGIERSSPRWVFPEFVAEAARFVRTLE